MNIIVILIIVVAVIIVVNESFIDGKKKPLKNVEEKSNQLKRPTLEDLKESKGQATLSNHISDVVIKHPETVKHLTEKEVKTIEKINSRKKRK